MHAVRLGSWRWWFENRETHEITIAQFPNWPLLAIPIGWLAERLTNQDSTLHQLIGSPRPGCGSTGDSMS
jgi:hypothetical protein